MGFSAGLLYDILHILLESVDYKEELWTDYGARVVGVSIRDGQIQLETVKN